MDYKKAYEDLSKALWRFDKVHNDAYVQLILAFKDIDNELADITLPPQGALKECALSDC